MVELLVTLVLMALVASAVAPQINTWLSSRERATVIAEVSSKISLLPLQASRNEKRIEIGDFSDLGLQNNSLNIIEPIEVLPSGFCTGGRYEMLTTNSSIEFQVTPPLCKVIRINEG